MKPLKIIISITLLALINSTANAAGSGAAAPCVRADLTGTWTAVINGMGSYSTQKCTIGVNNAGVLTAGSCKDIKTNTVYKPRSGSATVNAQCNVNFSISYTNGAVSKATGAISRGRDTIIGTYTNNFGDFGSFSAVKY